MSDISVIAGTLSADPQYVESDKGSFWKFSVPEKKRDNATVWYNFTFSGNPDHPVLKICKKGSSVVVTSKPPYTLNEYSFTAYDPKKKSAGCQRDVIDITFGAYEKKAKPEETEESPDDFGFPPIATADPLVPEHNTEFEIPVSSRGPNFS